MKPRVPSYAPLFRFLICSFSIVATACSPSTDAEHDRLMDLFAREWENRLNENPVFATSVGDLRGNGLLTSVAPEDLARRYEQDKAFLAELSTFSRDDLSTTDRINAAMFERQLSARVKDYELGAWMIPLNADSGFHINFSRIHRQVPLHTVGHYDDLISRLRAWPTLVEQQIANMRAGLESGMKLPKVVLDGYDSTYDAHVVADAEESVFFRAFDRFPKSVPPQEQERIREQGTAAILEAVVPGYAAFSKFMKEEYIPNGTEGIAATDLPNGEAYYDHQVKYYTTLDVTADQVHEIGLQEVERIRAEMDAILEELEWKDTFDAFLEFLRTDPRFYAETPQDLLKEASFIAKEVDGKLPAYFGTLPRRPYTVEAVPAHMAPKYTAGRYVGPSEGSNEPGIYWVNTFDLKVRPLYNLVALTLHEAVPGHHLQNALAREQEGLPNFRRYDYISAYGEGWALYTEFLGEEMGMYKDPYSRFGRLTYEMWRACRLVVDTGMHAKGWSRQQGRDYLAENTALPLHEIGTEIDRYISWPGQALSYKMGELTIRRLRAMAEGALGPAFNIRQFHDVMLLNGSVPLPVLEQQVGAYVAAARSAIAAQAGGGS